MSGYIGCDGMAHGHNVDSIKRGSNSAYDAACTLWDEGYNGAEISRRTGLSKSATWRCLKRNGRLKRESRVKRKLPAVYRFETALEYVDEVRIFRGPDDEDGSSTYLVSLCDEKIVGEAKGGIRLALNSAMKLYREANSEW